MAGKYSWIPCFEARKDLLVYKQDALLLFALSLRFNIDDFGSLVSTALTEGGDDKKTDLIHIDAEEGYAVIAQTTISQDWSKKEASANKAADLSTAVTWLLVMPIDQVPETIKSQAVELRRAINDGSIKSLHLWYVHNLPESINVQKELSGVEQSARSALRSNFPGSENIEIQSLEIGVNIIESWYTSLQRPILVSELFEIDISGGYELSGKDWRAFVTAVPVALLHEIYNHYKDDILSANVRGYLGSRKTDNNINNGIRETGSSDPDHFWVFNNGITALVHSFEEIKNKKDHKVRIKGLSIVNGAQTTGAIGSLAQKPAADAKVQVRFITCNDPQTIQNIVKYNNSQNRITAPDFRSGDPVQTRLMSEFKSLPGLEYFARRGGYEDLKLRGPILASITAGQALAATHGDPDTAYNHKTHIWESDSLYSRFFNDFTTADHLFFAYSLLAAVERKKIDLVEKSRTNSLTKEEEAQLAFLRERGSIILFTSAMASCLEAFLSKPIPNLFKIIYKRKISLDEALSIWQPLIDTGISFAAHLKEGLSDGLKNSENINKAMALFRSLIGSTKVANAKVYADFANNVASLP